MSTFAGTNRWAVDTSDFLGFKHSTYKQKMYNYSIVNPSQYTTMRMNAIEKIKFLAVAKIYDEFFAILSKGTDKDSNPLITINGNLEPPCYPQQLVTELALEAAELLQAQVEKVCDIVLPDYQAIANKQIKAKTDASFIAT